MVSFKDIFIETFNDLGKLSDLELSKGQKLSDENDFIKVDGTVFYNAISKIKQNDFNRMNQGLPSKGLDTLTVYARGDYNSKNCFLGKNNSSGYCITKDGELVSVFSTKGSSGDAIMKSAVANGAKYLDCFALRDEMGTISGKLFKLYSKYGFKIDTSMNSGKKGEAYAIVKGVSDYVDDNEQVHPEDERVVIFMKR